MWNDRMENIGKRWNRFSSEKSEEEMREKSDVSHRGEDPLLSSSPIKNMLDVYTLEDFVRYFLFLSFSLNHL